MGYAFVDGRTLGIPYWPLGIALVGLLITFVAALRRRLAERGLEEPPRPARLMGGLFVLGNAASLLSGLVYAGGRAEGAGPLSVFALVTGVALLVAMAATLVVGLSMRRGRPNLIGAALALGWLTAHAGIGYGLAYSTVRFPRIATHLDYYHEGREAPPARLEGPTEGWSVAERRVTRGLEGREAIRIVARHRSGMVLEAPYAIRALPELGDARFDLRVGNRWTYREERGQTDAVFLGERAERVSVSDVRLTVVGARVRDGLREYLVRRTSGASADLPSPSRTRELWLHAVEGEVRARVSADAAAPIFGGPAGAAGFELLAGACAGIRPPSERSPVAGVCSCETSSRSTSGSLIGQLLGQSQATTHTRRHEYSLVSTARGPDDAPAVTEVRPLPPPAPCLVLGPGDRVSLDVLLTAPGARSARRLARAWGELDGIEAEARQGDVRVVGSLRALERELEIRVRHPPVGCPWDPCVAVIEGRPEGVERVVWGGVRSGG